MTDLISKFDQKLKELTSNSRPIIDELTIIARDNPLIADSILELIKSRIYKVIPEQKLFTLYLLDSIVKTIGNPYNILISDDVFEIFCHVFQLVTDPIRNKMVNLFNTWKETKIGNNESLFPQDQLEKIEQFLNRAGYPKKQTVSSEQQLLINDIDQILPIFENKLRYNPEIKLQERFKALNQLKLMLTNQIIKPNELIAVQTHINNIKQQELTPTPIINEQTIKEQTPPKLTGISSLPPIPKIPKINIAINLFEDLILSGLVCKKQEPIPGSKPSYELVFPENKYVPISANEDIPIDSLEDILLTSSNIPRSEYDKLKFDEILQVTKKTKNNDTLQQFINSNKPSLQMIDLLYEDKPKKCPTCGKRFTNDTDGITRHRLHLDWHFRINKKITQKGGNIQSRNWYLDDFDWVHFKDEDLLEFATTINTTTTIANIDTTMNDATNENLEISTNYVIVPSNDTNMINRCIICREQIKATYNDEIGEWCWQDCIKQPGESKNSRKIVHITCFNESTKKRNAENDLINPNIKREKV